MQNQQRMMWLLRAEGLALLVLSCTAYAQFGGGWKQFALLFLLPDVALLGYLLGTHVGALAYNATHSYLGAAILVGAGLALSQRDLLLFGLIWFAHIGFDRALGYGLKYSEGFRHTHLGVIGRQH